MATETVQWSICFFLTCKRFIARLVLNISTKTEVSIRCMFTISDLLTPSSLRISFCRPQTCTKLKIYGDAGHLQKRVLESEMIFDRINQKKQIFKSSLKNPFFKIGIFLTFICNYQFLALLSVFDHLCVTYIFILLANAEKSKVFFQN